MNPLAGEPVLVVKPQTRRHSNARFIPENASLQGFDVQVHRVEEAGIYGNAIWQYRNDPERTALEPGPLDAMGELPYEYVEDQVVAGFAAVSSTALPIVGFNLLNYGWRVVAADGIRRVRDTGAANPPYDFTDIIPRTIDLQDAIVETALEARRSDSSLPPVKHGAFKLATLLEHNDIRLVAQNVAFPADPLGALWYFMVAGGKISVDGTTHTIPERVMLQLSGEVARFDDAMTWIVQVRENGWTRDVRVGNYRQVERRLTGVYDVYLAALSSS